MITKLRRFAGKIKRRLLGIKDISGEGMGNENYANMIGILRESKYFDPEYYLRKNPDVATAKADPYVHYYLNGWKESRDPSESFSNDLYLDLNRKNMPEKMNPVIHFETVGRDNPEVIGPGHRRFPGFKTVSDNLEERFKDIAPVNTMVVPDSAKRLNAVFDSFDGSCFFGEKALMLALAVLYANKNGLVLRIVSQNPERYLMADFCKTFSLEEPQSIEYFATDFNIRLEVSDKDDFLCSSWKSAAALLNTSTAVGNVFVFMDTAEILEYGYGDDRLKCFNTLTDPRIIPIVGSEALHEYLLNNGFDGLRDRGACVGAVAVANDLKPGEDSFKAKDGYVLFFGGRPEIGKDICYFGLDCLNQAFLTGRLNTDKWTVYIAGDTSLSEIHFDSDVKVNYLGRMTRKEYCDMLSKADLCFCLDYSPSVSYKVLDGAAAGAVCVTNRFAGVGAPQGLSENIIMADLNKEAMLKALQKGAELAADAETRRANYENIRTEVSMQEMLDPIISHMQSHVEGK